MTSLNLTLTLTLTPIPTLTLTLTPTPNPTLTLTLALAHHPCSAAHGVLRPLVSLDAPWCADYGVVSGYNEDFPERGPGEKGDEQVLPAEGVPPRGPHSGRSAPVRDFNKNMFQC